MPQHHGGQTGTLADAAMQASQAAIEACHAACWLRDEEAAGSNPATPTQVKGHSPQWDVAFSSRCPIQPYQARRLTAPLAPATGLCVGTPARHGRADTSQKRQI
jgi:hypothetical protein